MIVRAARARRKLLLGVLVGLLSVVVSPQLRVLLSTLFESISNAVSEILWSAGSCLTDS